MPERVSRWPHPGRTSLPRFGAFLNSSFRGFSATCRVGFAHHNGVRLVGTAHPTKGALQCWNFQFFQKVQVKSCHS